MKNVLIDVLNVRGFILSLLNKISIVWFIFYYQLKKCKIVLQLRILYTKGIWQVKVLIYVKSCINKSTITI